MPYDAARRRFIVQTPAPATGKVVARFPTRVVLLEDDERQPLEVLGTAGVGGVDVGDLVLVVMTDDAAWIAGKD